MDRMIKYLVVYKLLKCNSCFFPLKKFVLIAFQQTVGTLVKGIKHTQQNICFCYFCSTLFLFSVLFC